MGLSFAVCYLAVASMACRGGAVPRTNPAMVIRVASPTWLVRVFKFVCTRGGDGVGAVRTVFQLYDPSRGWLHLHAIEQTKAQR